MKIVILIAFLWIHATGSGQEVRVTSGKIPLQSPIDVHLTTPLTSNYTYFLRDEQGNLVRAQLKDSLTLVFIPLKSIPPNTTAVYRVEPRKIKFSIPDVKVFKKKQGFLVKVKRKPILFYHTAEAMPPADSPSFYKRSGFIHPLYSPHGQILTDDFPAGHAHQHAIFSAWVNTIFKNQPLDFWNQFQKTGTVAHANTVSVKEGPVFLEMITNLDYKSFSYGTVLSEEWKLCIYTYADYFLFDLESTQTNVSTDTLFLKAYHYGGMAFRGSREWNPDDKKYFRSNWQVLTSEGIRDSAANGTHAKWVDASGKVAGRIAGTTVFNHPSNFRYPQAIRVHPTMPYWCYAPVVDGAFSIPPGQIYRAKFRYYVHQNQANPKMIEQLFAEWTTAPKVEVH